MGRCLLWIAGSTMLSVVVAGLTGWAVLAIQFGDSHTSPLQTAMAAAFGVAGLLAIVGTFLRGWRIKALGGFSILFAGMLVSWLCIEPSNDRAWQPEVARLPYATIDGERITVHNIRNFAYRTETDFTPVYYTKTYDLTKLESVDLFVTYWMGPVIAHTIVSFGFGGEDFLAVSVEARKELGEGYSSLKGFFRQYELIYVVADERDVIRLRTNYRNDPPEEVYRYRMYATPETGRRFFLEYMKTINDVRAHPRFYNTLTTNCTNVIWLHAHVNPERVPFSWKILASGYVPEYLYDMGRLDTSVSFAELTQRGHVNPIAQALGDTPEFSRQIRKTESPPAAAVSR
jgi:hypothetical protein